MPEAVPMNLTKTVDIDFINLGFRISCDAVENRPETEVVRRSSEKGKTKKAKEIDSSD